MKNKGFIILAIIIIIIIIIITTILLLITKKYLNSDNYETDFEQQVLIEPDEKIEILDNKNKYFAIKRALYSIITNIQKINGEIEYNDEISSVQQEELKKEALEEGTEYFEGIIDSQYINEMNFKKQDIVNVAKKYDKYNLTIDKIYAYNKSNYIDIMLVYAYIGNEEFSIIMKMDTDNQTFSIFLNDYIEKYNYNESMNVDNIKINEEPIKENNNNTFEYININDESMAQYYLYDYGEKVSNNINLAYKNIDEQYKKERFSTLESYKKYIDNSEKNYQLLKLQSYLVEKLDNYTIYTCIDQYGNKYIFKETSIMQYTVQLDDYTIETETFRKRYSVANNKQRGILNIDKFIQMLNMQDYESAYNVLDNSFKQNNFKTQAEFENYMKQHTFKYNEVTYNQYNNKISSLHTYDIQLTDLSKQSQEVYNITITVKLLEDTKFSLSFERDV